MEFLNKLLKKSAKDEPRKIPLDLVMQARAHLMGTHSGRATFAYLHYEFGWGKTIATPEDIANHNMIMHLRSLCGLNDRALAGKIAQVEFECAAQDAGMIECLKRLYKLGIDRDSYDIKEQKEDLFADLRDRLPAAKNITNGGADLL